MKAKYLFVLCSLSYILNSTQIKQQDGLATPNKDILSQHIQRHIKKMKKEQRKNNNIVHVYCSKSSLKKQPEALSNVIFFD